MTRRISTGYGLSGGGGLGAILVQGSTLSTSGNDNLNLAGSGTGVVNTPDVLNVTNTTAATSSTAGAIKVAGGAAVVGNVNLGTTFRATNGINGVSIGTVTPRAAQFTDLTAQGLTTLAETAEITQALTGATGTVVHNFTVANTFVHTSIAANFVCNITNVPTTNNRVITITLVLVQGAIPYYPTAIQIDGAAQTVNWLGSTPTANNTAVLTISLIRSSSAWTVTASYADHGPVLDGSTSALAAPSASFIKAATGTTTDGIYWINLPRLGPTQMYCDMNIDGGGWMMFGYLGSVSGIGNVQQAIFSAFGTIGTTRTNNGTSFCRFDIAKLMSGAAPGTTQLMWRRTTNSNIIMIHSMDELFNRAASDPQGGSGGTATLNFENNPLGTQIGYPISTFKISNSGVAGLKRVPGARYEGGPTYPGIAWNSEYQNNTDGVGSYTDWLNRRSVWYWETNGVESNNQWTHASGMTLAPSASPTTGTGIKDVEIYFRVNPLGNN